MQTGGRSGHPAAACPGPLSVLCGALHPPWARGARAWRWPGGSSPAPFLASSPASFSQGKDAVTMWQPEKVGCPGLHWWE